MTLMLKNVDPNTLRVIESLQGLNKKLEITQMSKSSSKAIAKAMQESEEILSQIAAGKREPYNTWEEAKAALLAK